MNGPVYMTAKEAANQLRVGLATMRRYLRQGRVPSAKIGKRYLIPAGEVEKYVQANLLSSKGNSRLRAAASAESAPLVDSEPQLADRPGAA